MKAPVLEQTLAWINGYDLQLCVAVNRSCRLQSVRNFFAVVSRLGDGVFWYLWMVALPLFTGQAGLVVTLQMVAAGLVGLQLYRAIKDMTHRVRPYVASRLIFKGASPLDRFSFPSGHTLHAVCFTTLVVTAFPVTGWVLIPFAVLVALSRPVLGLHYPSDVLVGAVTGYGLAQLAIYVTPMVGL